MSDRPQFARYFAAVDLGASSGRIVAARVGDDGIRLSEMPRFDNGPVLQYDVLCWAVDRLFDETVRGLAAVAEEARVEGAVFAGIGVDTWGVDYGLLDADRALLPRVKHHQGADPTGPTEAAKVLSGADVYRFAGIPPQAINTSYQLRSDVRGATDRGDELVLLIPDLWVRYWTGVVGAERTIASTTQLFDPQTGDWSPTLIAAYGLDTCVFPPPTDAGTFVARTTPEVTARMGTMLSVPVYRVAGHDTASALPFAKPDGAEFLISSGSWSLAGVCLPQPLLTDAGRAAVFTDEPGIRESTLFLRNSAGVWLLTECTRLWAERGEANPDVGPPVHRAAIEPVRSPPIFNVADPRLLEPGDMPARIKALCREGDQPAPCSVVGTVRSIIESLATAYADAASAFERLTGVSLTSVRIVGGGSRNDLCQRTAEMTGLPVMAGPAEATALGNLAVQLVAAGEMTSIGAAYEHFDVDWGARTSSGRYLGAPVLRNGG